MVDEASGQRLLCPQQITYTIEGSDLGSALRAGNEVFKGLSGGPIERPEQVHQPVARDTFRHE
jgi:hypothetical protein